MFRASLNKIYLTRGDTARFSIGLAPNTEDYKLTTSDDVYFIVTRTKDVVNLDDLDSDEDKYIFYKKGISVVIDPEDTQDLDYGTYYYHVRVVLYQSGDLNTIIEPSEFRITPEEGNTYI